VARTSGDGDRIERERLIRGSAVGVGAGSGEGPGPGPGSNVRDRAAALGRGQARVGPPAAGVEVGPPAATPRRPVVDALEVRRRLDAGATLLGIAAELGRSAGVLRRVLRMAGLPVPPWRPPRPVLDPAALRDWYLGELLSIDQIATRVGYSRGTVAAALRAAGVPRRDRRDRPTRAGRPVITADRLTELYLRRGLTARQVAAELGCEPSAVAAALKRHCFTRPVNAAGLDVDRETLTRLSVTERLGDGAIGARYGVPAWQVTRRRRELDVHRPPGTPRPDPPPTPAPPPAADLHRLYVDLALPIRVIAEQQHTSQRTVRGWLTAAGYQPGRPGDRRGGPPGQPDPVRAALYADPQVTALLCRHQIPRHPVADDGPDRSPGPALTRPFLDQAYRHIGLSVEHIGQLTGHPPDHVRQALHAAGIRTHSDSAFSPWAARRDVGVG
jgi:AraC-like DNA-binding protein